ncbi:uncharacterized protein LOC122001476 [Zingiber officinale]|uniref:uncharacterized protein LOC122001476 n=1 Tax=Zingiber officinale TaxID=94328 RepID=UPI001C4D323F|nr:uncharacterized protein LOC122001476 [Zingiber officinale]
MPFLRSPLLSAPSLPDAAAGRVPSSRTKQCRDNRSSPLHIVIPTPLCRHLSPSADRRPFVPSHLRRRRLLIPLPSSSPTSHRRPLFCTGALATVDAAWRSADGLLPTAAEALTSSPSAAVERRVSATLPLPSSPSHIAELFPLRAVCPRSPEFRRLTTYSAATGDHMKLWDLFSAANLSLLWINNQG